MNSFNFISKTFSARVKKGGNIFSKFLVSILEKISMKFFFCTNYKIICMLFYNSKKYHIFSKFYPKIVSATFFYMGLMTYFSTFSNEMSANLGKISTKSFKWFESINCQNQKLWPQIPKKNFRLKLFSAYLGAKPCGKCDINICIVVIIHYSWNPVDTRMRSANILLHEHFACKLSRSHLSRTRLPRARRIV